MFREYLYFSGGFTSDHQTLNMNRRSDDLSLGVYSGTSYNVATVNRYTQTVYQSQSYRTPVYPIMLKSQFYMIA